MKDSDIEAKLEKALNDLRPVSPRDSRAAARGKANFLTQASQMREAVSQEQGERLTGWNKKIFPAFPRKERTPVFNAVLAIVLALAVFFGGTGATVYAAQDSLPDQALYPVKTWSEDALLSLPGSLQTRMGYELNFSDRRLAEMTALVSAGTPIPESVVTRLQNQLDQALELAAGLDDPQMLQELQQVRQRSETQLQVLQGLVAGAPQSEQPALLMAQDRIQEQLQLCALGQADPQGFRQQVRERVQMRNGSGNPVPDSGDGPMDTTATPIPTGMGNGSGPGGDQSTMMPGGMGPGPMSPDHTPQPGSGSGHGP
jgi:hypothetical protein